MGRKPLDIDKLAMELVLTDNLDDKKVKAKKTNLKVFTTKAVN